MLYISTKLNNNNNKNPENNKGKKLPQNSVDIKDMSLPSFWRSAPALHPRQKRNQKQASLFECLHNRDSSDP